MADNKNLTDKEKKAFKAALSKLDKNATDYNDKWEELIKKYADKVKS